MNPPFISNDIINNLKFYVSGGLALNAMVGANIDSKSNYQPIATDPIKYYTAELSFLGLDFVGSTGVEYELDNGMKLLLGVSYMHGLLNVNARSDEFIKKSGFVFKNGLIALDLGLKF